jgi:hypothetical protein
MSRLFAQAFSLFCYKDIATGAVSDRLHCWHERIEMTARTSAPIAYLI